MSVLLWPEAACSHTNSQVTRELATYISGLIRSPNDLHQLRQIVPVGTGFWAAQLASNMQRRYSIIVQRLRENVQNAAHGDGVVRTIENLRALFAAIDSIRRDHFQTMSLAERRPFFTLLMDILEYSLLNDHDQYGSSARPAYAGEGVQSERRLFMAFLAPRAQPLAFLAVIWHCGSALVREFRGRIDRMRVTLEGFWQRMGEDHPNRAQLARVKQYLGSLAQRTHKAHSDHDGQCASLTICSRSYPAVIEEQTSSCLRESENAICFR